ncbi:hypothetical protein [Microcoleus sp. B3-D7]|uniref:hypothetical protein n=1 Tax=Microcoleus sp. B3-D7 TaxID=2818659 RepID=UPI002FCE7160
MTDIRWLWYVTSACWWQRGSAKTGVRKLVCENWCAIELFTHFALSLRLTLAKVGELLNGKT